MAFAFGTVNLLHISFVNYFFFFSISSSGLVPAIPLFFILYKQGMKYQYEIVCIQGIFPLRLFIAECFA